MPLPVLGFVCTYVSSTAFSSVSATTLRIYLLEVDLVNLPVPVWVQYIMGNGIAFNASTGNLPCQYWYILAQYQYRHGTLPVLALNGARTGIGCVIFLGDPFSITHVSYNHICNLQHT
jgi:hypothetical protein